MGQMQRVLLKVKMYKVNKNALKTTTKSMRTENTSEKTTFLYTFSWPRKRFDARTLHLKGKPNVFMVYFKILVILSFFLFCCGFL